jgi:uncharacterized protein YjbI with pentapeptide repeats
MMVLIRSKKISLENEAQKGLSSLIHQGVIVLIVFIAMLLLTGGAPSFLAVAIAVVLSGIAVTWLEQVRWFNRKKTLRSEKHSKPRETSKPLVPDMSLYPLQSGETFNELIEQLLPKGISANKSAVLRRKLSQLVKQGESIEGIQSLISIVVESSGDFFELASIAKLNLVNDLIGANLIGVSLVKANLSGINFVKANLSQADLHEAWLHKTNFGGANLTEANLCQADLREANLYKADLSKADLSWTDLSWADLSWADLHGSILREAILYRTYLSETCLKGALLNGANLSGADLNGADLREANLSGANLIEANVKDTRLDGTFGITPELKIELLDRGAIFDDSLRNQNKAISPSLQPLYKQLEISKKVDEPYGEENLNSSMVQTTPWHDQYFEKLRNLSVNSQKGSL